jgi:putative transposase
MPRPPRIIPDGIPQHVVNRGNQRATIFSDAADYLGFLAAMAKAAEQTTVRLMAYCLMPNHWHLVLWPFVGREISRYIQLVMNHHVHDLQRRHGTSGTGHIYQGRFKNSHILTERQFVNVCRYVEANPLCAGLVNRADDWAWSSLTRSGPDEGINLLSPWPFSRPKRWLEEVNRPQANKLQREIERAVERRSKGQHVVVAIR